MEDASYSEAFETETKKRKSFSILFFAIFVIIDIIVIVAAVLFYLSWAPGNTFPVSATVTPGSSAAEVANLLEREGLVKSEDLLYLAIVFFNDPSNIKAGTHVFTEPMNTFEVATFITQNIPADELISVTYPEGFTHFEFNDFLPSNIEPLDTDLTEYEGTLFPDTYLVPKDFTATELLELMEKTQTEKLAPLAPAIAASEFTQGEVLILASIIEREANDHESMHLVSGILLNRIEIGMPLQVDASVAYGLGISGTELTRTHLETDGPFNTYTRSGLPPTPIANPGLMAIEAVLNPTPSEYLFYITGNDGNFYYAETLDEHNLNIARHLR